MEQLPVDILTDIFSRLPAKTLARLKIVCKSWYDIINDDYFVDRHLERSLATKTNLHCIVAAPRPYLQQFDRHPEPRMITCPVLYSADYNSLENPTELHHPFKNCRTGVWLVGSCRGLVLLRVGCRFFLLYNPTTQTYNALPQFPPDYEPLWSDNVFNYGFGYDSFSEDYKCVRIKQYFDDDTGDFVSEVMVYSLNTNCWTSVSNVPCYFSTYGLYTGTLVREIVHWIGVNIEIVYECIVAFNLRDETFSYLPLPNFQLQQSERLYAGTLDGCLCLLANRHTDNNYHYLRCDVWVMKEYGVAGSWTRMFTFEELQCSHLERPIGYSMNKKRLLVTSSSYKLVYLDLETMETTEVTFADWDTGLDAHVYVENLHMLEYTEFADDDSY